VSALTAYAPTDVLVSSLARSGWGDLTGREHQGMRSTLRALVDRLDYRTGEGEATVAQIADTAGLSERWVRRCLGLLEDAGLIRWDRGGVLAGKPQPSAFRIVKSAIVAMIRGARPVLAAIRARRAQATAARLAGLAFVRPRVRRKRRSIHAELSADLHHPSGGGVPPHQGRGTSPAPVDGIPLDPHRPGECIHGLPAHLTTRTGEPRCADCRHVLRTRRPQ